MQRSWLPASAAVQFDISELLLDDLRFNLQIRKFIPKALILDPKALPLLFTSLNFFLQQDSPLDGNIVLGFHVLQ